MPTLRLVAPLALAVSFGAASALAQPVPSRMPGSTHIFPAGGQRGTTVEVRVGAECIPPGANFYLSGARVSAADVLGPRLPFRGEPSPRRLPTEIPICYPKEWQSKIEISADAPLGPCYWRLSCAQGGTGSRPFIVGDLREFIESESNSVPERAEPIEAPLTINGQICGERDVDYFRLTKASGVIVCQMLAARLGSPLDPLVDVFDAAGKRISVERRYAGSDSTLLFEAEPSREYLLRVANVSEQGSPAHVYRINVTVAKDWSATFARREPDALPEARTNLTREAAEPVSLPARIQGEFSPESEEHWYALALPAGETVSIACDSLPLGGPEALPTLLLTDATGKELAKAKSVDFSDGICRLEWKATEERDLRLRVRDLRTNTRGPGLGYRLTVERAEPDFALSLPADIVNVMPGGKTQIEVAVRRHGGFTGPIELRLEPDWLPALPASVKLEGSQIPAGASTAKLTISAGEDAAAGSFALRLIGAGEALGRKMERVAKARHLGVDAIGKSVELPTLDLLHLTVQHKPIFRLFCAEAYQYAHRGTVYGYLMEVERLNGFEGPIFLEPGDRQNRDLDGIEIGQIVVPPGETQVMVPIYLPETMHINVQSQSQLYTQGHASFVDKHGQKQSVLVVSEKRNMLRTLPPVVKLKASGAETRLAPGESAKLKLELERTSNYRGPLAVQLAGVAERGVTCKNAVIESDETSVEIQIHVAPDAARGTSFNLHFRGTGKMSSTTEVVSEAIVRVRVE